MLDALGAPTGLYVEVLARHVAKPDVKMFKATVFQTDPAGPQRIYQLDVTQHPRLPRDRHQWPHEHIGDERVLGEAGWLDWSFDEIMARFSGTTGIGFVPPLRDPFDFRLTS